MRRTDIEERLTELGWTSSGELSGKRHTIWRRRGTTRIITVPTEDLINNQTAERLLEEAER